MIDTIYIFLIFICTGVMERYLNDFCKAHPTWWINCPISSQYFGDNKTWRGFINHTSVNILVTALFYIILRKLKLSTTIELGDILSVGAGGGFVWPLGELPNSFMKRFLGIRSGTYHQNKWIGMAQYIIDHLDSSFALILYLVLWNGYDTSLFYCLPIAMICHMIHKWTMDHIRVSITKIQPRLA